MIEDDEGLEMGGGWYYSHIIQGRPMFPGYILCGGYFSHDKH